MFRRILFIVCMAILSLSAYGQSTLATLDVSIGGGGSNPVSTQNLIRAFQAVVLTQVNADTASGWNSTTFTYTIPVSGLYTITSSLRLVDDTVTASFAEGVTSPPGGDGPWMVWNQFTGKRTTLLTTRSANLTAGTQLQMFGYCDSYSACNIDSGHFVIQQQCTLALCSGSGGGFVPPSGTGYIHVTSGTMDGTAQLVNLATGVTGLLPVGNITGLATSATTDTTNASNITSGTLGSARFGTLTGDVSNSGYATTVHGINGTAITSLTGILKLTAGIPSVATAGTDYLLPTGSGVNLTNINAAALASGTVPSARLPLATTSIAGAVIVDGTTITISGGVISAVGGGGGSGGLADPGADGLVYRTSLNVTAIATATQIETALANDTVNNTAWGFRAGSGGSGTLPTPTAGVDYIAYSNGGIVRSHNGSSYFALMNPSCQPGVGDGLNVIAAGTYLTTTCRNDTGFTWTLTSITCFADTGSSTCNASNGSGTSLLTGAITGTTSYATGTQSSTTTIAPGDFIKVTFVADGTSHQIGIDVSGAY